VTQCQKTREGHIGLTQASQTLRSQASARPPCRQSRCWVYVNGTIAIDDLHWVLCFIHWYLCFIIQTFISDILYSDHWILVHQGEIRVIGWLNIKTDYLHCNPRFSGHPRYDFVIANLPQGCTFTQLVFIFICSAGGQDHCLVLVRHWKRYPKPLWRELIRSCWFTDGISGLGQGVKSFHWIASCAAQCW